MTKAEELLTACIKAMHLVQDTGNLDHLDCAPDGGQFWRDALEQAEDFLKNKSEETENDKVAKWTTQKPTTAGHYWCVCRGELSGREYVTVVRVYARSTVPGAPVDTVFWDGDNCNLTQDSFVRWSDRPLPALS